MSDEKKSTPPEAVPVRPNSVLTKDTDKAARPGFRSPPNAKSKAQKKQ